MAVTMKAPVRVRIDREVTHFIRQWRKHRQLGIVELGTAAGVSASMISQLETGKANYTQVTLEALAKALGVHPAVLVWADPTCEQVSWSALLQGWDRYNGHDGDVFDLLINAGVEAAVKAAAQSATALTRKAELWAVQQP